jgi:hypothetical protein
MPRISRTKEQFARYRMLFVVIMKPHETFTNRAMKRPSVRTRLPMRVEPSKVEPKGWGDNALEVTPTYVRRKE